MELQSPPSRIALWLAPIHGQGHRLWRVNAFRTGPIASVLNCAARQFGGWLLCSEDPEENFPSILQRPVPVTRSECNLTAALIAIPFAIQTVDRIYGALTLKRNSITGPNNGSQED